MMAVVIVLALAILVIGYLVFGRSRPAAPALEEPTQERAPKREERATAAKDEKPAGRAPAPAAVVEKVAVVPEPEPGRAVEPTPSANLPRQPGDIAGLRRGLARSRDDQGLFGKLKSLLAGKGEISPEIASEIEELLLASDVGVQTTQQILTRLQDQLARGELRDSSRVWAALRAEAIRILDVDGSAGKVVLKHKPTVILMVGVNGAGKTTTIGKLAQKFTADGHTCLLAAGDTFRAAAVQQLVVWGKRIGCEVVKGKDGSDPSSVIFTAVEQAKAAGTGVVLADTAGRLHTKANLMSEMQKISKTASKALEGAPHEILLVLDATSGQNAISQAQEFKAVLNLSGIVLTKLDGTAKGGVVLGISDALKLPVRYIGLGERADDLHEFDARDFVEALLGEHDELSA